MDERQREGDRHHRNCRKSRRRIGCARSRHGVKRERDLEGVERSGRPHAYVNRVVEHCPKYIIVTNLHF